VKFSPSQISTFRECRRKWYYSSVLRLPRDVSASAELGSAIHAVLEDFLQGVELTYPTGQIEKLLKPVLADPFYQDLVGKCAVEDTANSKFHAYEMNGRVDVHWQDPADPDHWFIMDHKTSKDPGKWGKTVAEAETDPQTVCYAYDILTKHKVSRVTVIYAYICTAGPRNVQYVYARHTAETLQPLLSSLYLDLMGMEGIRKDPCEDLIPRTTSACWNFGGCSFRNRCYGNSDADETDDVPPTTLEPKGPPVDINALLRKRNKPPAAVTPPAPVAAPVALPQVKQPAPAPIVVAAPAPVVTAPVVAVEAPVPEATVPEVTPVIAEAVVAEVTEPKKRGRPRKVKANEPVPTVVPAAVTTYVFVNCTPLGLPCKSLEQFLHEDTDLIKRYETQTREAYLEDQYGKGPKLISAELIASIVSGAVELPAHLYVSRDSQFAKFLLGEFARFEGVVVVFG
jgi:CRISPR/Cas system-associated exonuclease Cas4 (RecB family)